MRLLGARGNSPWSLMGTVLLIVALLNACSSSSKKSGSESASSSSSSGGRYQGKDKDWGPDKEIDMSKVPDAVPRYENRTIAGNKNPYTVLGKTYYLMEDERSYKERGKASWYGYKFNGERTSNGELYDMFAMTGAHKTLPIPSYVRVTNLDNRKSVVVRINDRGPFHDGRIIDLSYAAAQRLGITRLGTGNVEVEIVVPEGDPRPPLRSRKAELASSVKESGVISKADAGVSAQDDKLPEGTYLQIGAFSIESSAKDFARNLRKELRFPVVVSASKTAQRLFRVRVGPFKDTQSIELARDQLQKVGILESHIVYQ